MIVWNRPVLAFGYRCPVCLATPESGASHALPGGKVCPVGLWEVEPSETTWGRLDVPDAAPAPAQADTAEFHELTGDLGYRSRVNAGR